MKKNLMISILMTLVTTVLLGLIYPLAMTAFIAGSISRQGERTTGRS